MPFYLLWILAFLLKLVGATWDASWHFKYLRDTFAPPHTINIIGFVLVCCLLLYQMRTHKGLEPRGLRITWLGMAVFLIAMPLDEAYHRAFGLDLTTWSPTHFMLYIGTFLMIAGVLASYLKQNQRTGWLYTLGLFALLFFLSEDVLFPLGQQEYGSVSLWLIQHGRPLAVPELLQFVKDPYYQAYGGFSLWLYPVYLMWGYSLVMSVARRLHTGRFAATAAAGTYLAFRAIAWLLLGSAGFPQSFIPYFMVGAALAIDLLGSVPLRSLRLLLQTAAITAVAYVAAPLWAQLPGMVMPPWPVDSWWAGAVLGYVGLVMGDYSQALLTGEGLAELPLMKAVNSAVQAVRLTIYR